MHNQYIFCVATPEKGPTKESIAQSLFTFKEVSNHHNNSHLICLFSMLSDCYKLMYFLFKLSDSERPFLDCKIEIAVNENKHSKVAFCVALCQNAHQTYFFVAR